MDPKGEYVKIAGAKYSLAKLRAHFKVEMCWPMLVTIKLDPRVVCPSWNKPGHKDGSQLHNEVTDARRAYFKAHEADFRFEKAPTGPKAPGALAKPAGAKALNA